jgi:hypothetical protein
MGGPLFGATNIPLGASKTCMPPDMNESKNEAVVDLEEESA